MTQREKAMIAEIEEMKNVLRSRLGMAKAEPQYSQISVPLNSEESRLFRIFLTALDISPRVSIVDRNLFEFEVLVREDSREYHLIRMFLEELVG